MNTRIVYCPAGRYQWFVDVWVDRAPNAGGFTSGWKNACCFTTRAEAEQFVAHLWADSRADSHKEATQ